tara:strand:- start:217 stop:732 length:516 start_codon:yes stop_codon:yes gene_type:complete
MEELMNHGPDALRLSRAFFRLKSFSPIQGIISNSIRFKRDKEEIENAISCGSAKSYEDIIKTLADILEHTEQLQLAVIYLLKPDNETDTYGKIEIRAKNAFNKMRRKGFEKQELDEGQRDVFLMAAEALPTITAQLRNFLQQTKQHDLPERFSVDKKKFSMQFDSIYGERI